MTDKTSTSAGPAGDPAPDPGNAPPEQWTGGPYADGDLDAQIDVALDGPSPLDDPNTSPPVAGEPPPGSDPDGRRGGEFAIEPGTTVDPGDVGLTPPTDTADADTAPGKPSKPTKATAGKATGGKMHGRQQPDSTMTGA